METLRLQTSTPELSRYRATIAGDDDGRAYARNIENYIGLTRVPIGINA
jgi:hydroxymethylglutaryl-CoA reductase